MCKASIIKLLRGRGTMTMWRKSMSLSFTPKPVHETPLPETTEQTLHLKAQTKEGTSQKHQEPGDGASI